MKFKNVILFFCLYSIQLAHAQMFTASFFKDYQKLSTSWLPQSANLIGLWHFDDSAAGAAPGGKDFLDSSIGAKHGTKGGTPTFAVTSPFKKAVSFNGTSSSGSVPLDLSGTPVVSISIWFNATANATGASCSIPANYNMFLELTSNFNSNQAFTFSLCDSTAGGAIAKSITAGMHGAGGYKIFYLSPGTITANVWHHLVLVYDRTNSINNTITVYLDGSVMSLNATSFTSSSSGNFANSSLFLAARNNSVGFAEVMINELAVWSVALTANDVKRIYNGQKP
jgi:hypothetical protein